MPREAHATEKRQKTSANKSTLSQNKLQLYHDHFAITRIQLTTQPYFSELL